jgi:predicted dehydrogenase
MPATRIAILGAGFMGGTHARAYAKRDDVEIAAIYAHSPERAQPLADEVGSRWVDNLNTILGDRSIDAVDICLPTTSHREAFDAAIDAGKHVLLEKPLALTEADAREMVARAAETDRVVMIAHVLRFWPEYVEIKRIIESGELGRPLAGLAARRQPFPAWSQLFTRADLTGGAILDQMIHDYDVMNWLFGTPLSVAAAGMVNPRSNGYDQTQVLIRYDEASGLVDGGMMMPESYPFTTRIEVLCENGSIEHHFRAGGRSFEIGEPTNELTVYRNEGDPERITVEQSDAYENETAYFIECLKQGQPALRATPSDALAALRVALAATESAASGKAVAL